MSLQASSRLPAESGAGTVCNTDLKTQDLTRLICTVTWFKGYYQLPPELTLPNMLHKTMFCKLKTFLMEIHSLSQKQFSKCLFCVRQGPRHFKFIGKREK